MTDKCVSCRVWIAILTGLKHQLFAGQCTDSVVMELMSFHTCRDVFIVQVVLIASQCKVSFRNFVLEGGALMGERGGVVGLLTMAMNSS